jgi:hypothetical protein
MVFSLFLQKICVQNIRADNSDCKKKIQGIMPTTNFLALIYLMPEKWVGLYILGKLALIFLALVTRPFLLRGYLGLWENLWRRSSIFVFYCIFMTQFFKRPPPPLCSSMFQLVSTVSVIFILFATAFGFKVRFKVRLSIIWNS